MTAGSSTYDAVDKRAREEIIRLWKEVGRLKRELAKQSKFIGETKE